MSNRLSSVPETRRGEVNAIGREQGEEGEHGGARASDRAGRRRKGKGSVSGMFCARDS